MRSIRTRITLWVVALIAGTFAVVFFLTGSIHRQSFTQTQAVTETVIRDFLRAGWQQKVESLAAMYADQLVLPVYTKDLEDIRNLTIVARSQGFVRSIYVLDENGIILSDGTEEALMLGRVYPEGNPGSRDSLVVTVPIATGPQVLGAVIMAFDTGEAEEAIAEMHASTGRLFSEALAESQTSMAAIFLLTLGAALAGALLLSRGLTRPLALLSDAIEKVGRNEYDIEVPRERSDEIGQLGRTLQEVAESLRSTTVSKAYLEQVLASMPVGVAVTDERGVLLSANRSLVAFCRLDEDAGAGQPLGELVGISGEGFREMLHSLRQGRAVREVEVVLSLTGCPVHAMLSAVSIVGENKRAAEYLFIVYNITERKELERQLRHIASHDHLTGLPNRRHIFSILETQMEAYMRDRSTPFWLVFLDLDRFKSVNDTYGHHLGDEVLKTVARRLREGGREEDLVARLGGDEFLVLLRGRIDREQALSVARRLVEQVREPIRIQDCEITVSASVGLTRSDPRHSSADEIVGEADAAMYEAKLQGKDRLVTIFDLDEASRKTRLALERDLKTAVSNGEIIPHYQPIVNIPSGRVLGFEALSRWEHPERGFVPPSTFIPLAEESGLILELGEAVLMAACRQQRLWRNAFGDIAFYISVNVSSRQIYDSDFPATVQQCLERTGADPEQLVLEFTESLIMHEPEIASKVMRSLRELGIRLAIDDFGTGYSSLSYLHQFPFNILKVDRSFVSGMHISPEQAKMMRIVCDIGRNLNMNVVVEGIEHATQALGVKDLGIDACQGYLYSTPLPADEIGRRLATDAGLFQPPPTDPRN